MPESIVKQLGFPITGTANVKYADHRIATREMAGNVWLKLCDRPSVFSAVVEPNRTEALIGAIVLEELDLIADCPIQKVYPRDPERIVSEVE